MMSKLDSMTFQVLVWLGGDPSVEQRFAVCSKSGNVLVRQMTDEIKVNETLEEHYPNLDSGSR